MPAFRFYITLLIGLLFFSFKKGGDVKYPQLYTATGLSLQTDTRLFANGQQISDKTVISKSIAGDNTFNLTFQASLNNVIRFSSADTATFGGLLAKYPVSKTGNMYLFYSQSYFPLPGTYLPGACLCKIYRCPNLSAIGA